MNNWINFQRILILFLILFSPGLKSQVENDTIETNPLVNEDSTLLFYLDSIPYIVTVEQKDTTNYRELIYQLMEKSTLKIRGLYVPGWKIINRSKIDKLMKFMAKYNFNNLIFDLKNANGEIFFQSTNKTALQINSQAKTDEGRIRSIDIDYLKLRAKEKNIKLTGRHVMFRDKVLYNEKEEYRFLEDQYWIDLRNQAVLEYNLALLKEEETLGLDEIAIDYIRFPETNEFGSFTEKNLQIEEIVQRVADIFKSKETEFGIFIFGYVAWGLDIGIGQNLTELEGLVDRIYPMVYPSHFSTGTLGYAVPGDYPYEIINESCQKSIELMDNPEKSVPMLQAFWCSQKKLYLQMQAVQDNQMSGFVLWNARGDYHLYFTYQIKTP